MLRDRDATAAKYEGMGHREVEVFELEGDNDSLRIGTSRVVDAELPGFAKKFLKPTNEVRQVDQWRRVADGAWEGSFEVEIHGSPVQMSGVMRLEPGGGMCTHEVTITVNVKVPLVGGRIADWAAKNEVRGTLDAEFAFGDRWLADHAG